MSANDLATLILAFGNAIAVIVVAFRQHSTISRGKEVLRQVTPPSNGHTLGSLMESSVASSYAAAVDSSRVRQEILPDKLPPPPLPYLPVPPTTEIVDTTIPPTPPPMGPDDASQTE